jgi:hypothetical protein
MNELLQVLGQLSEIYPHWRLGQLAANMAGLADTSLEAVSDSLLLEVARQHLARRLETLELPAARSGIGVSLVPSRRDLFDALHECYSRRTIGTLGCCLMRASEITSVNLFDIEDEELLDAVKHLSAAAIPSGQSLLAPHDVNLADESHTFRREDMYGPNGR